MDISELLQLLSQSAYTSVGFFWKAGWAFVLGYTISAMIQAFVPKARLVKFMGKMDAKSVSLATIFGMISSSCSFAALAAARSLLAKGGSFVAGVAFMFASTNLVIELGILIYIFLGWEFLVAEIIGGLLLITISSLLIKLFYPAGMVATMREKLEEDTAEEESFDPWRRIISFSGWKRVGMHFVHDWKMVWREILIGFTIAGLMAVFVQPSFWETIFFTGATALPGWLVALLNALVGPLVAAATFIGSMGNIPLATVLSANGVMFAGIMAFIYADLLVPPLVMINKKYYGLKPALFIAGIMYVSIVVTALILHLGFLSFAALPKSNRVISDVTRIGIDYTFWLNLVFALVAVVMIWLYLEHKKVMDHHHHMSMESGGAVKFAVAIICALFLVSGVAGHLMLTT